MLSDLAMLLSDLPLPPLTMLALVSAVIGLVLLWLSGRKATKGACVVLDGSNLMHWRDNTPQLQTLLQVLKVLKAQSLTPCVIFDANAGYLLGKEYMGPQALARALGLPARQVSVVPKGQPADRMILDCARAMGARVVSNDRFRDWAQDFPEIHDRTRFIRGGFDGDVLWLSDPAAGAPRPKRKTPAQAVRGGNVA